METSPKSVEFLQFHWDPTKLVLFKDGIEVQLRPKTLQTLKAFLEHPGDVLSKEELKRAIWPDLSSVANNNVDHQVAELRRILGDSASEPRIIATIPTRGYRFLPELTTPVVAKSDPPAGITITDEQTIGRENRIVSRVPRLSGFKVVLAEVLLIIAALIWGYFRFQGSRTLTDRDSILVADFENETGDPVFDGALRQGLSLQLEQSPFLNLLSEDRIAEALALMSRPKTTKLTGDIAREVCQRTGASLAVEGSISSLGRQFVLGLKAISCGTGDSIAQEQIVSPSREDVLSALGRASTTIRRKLGESLKTIQKFDVPLENVTTPSLEALRAYSLGSQALILRNDSSGALRFFQEAVSIDPNFAMAHAKLSASYSNSGEAALADQSIRRAYELRSRVSEREKYYITSHFHHLATGNLIEAQKIYEMWSQTYPRDADPIGDLDTIYYALGDYEKALDAAQRSVKLRPAGGLEYGNLVYGYLNVARLSEAKRAAHEAEIRHVDSSWIHEPLYLIAFLNHDEIAMQREVAAVKGKVGMEDVLLYYQSDTAAYAGSFRMARELTEAAVESAQRAKQTEAAAQYQAEAAFREAIVGNFDLARSFAKAAVNTVKGKDVAAIAATALALAGESNQIAPMANELSAHFPEDTIVRFNYVPVMQASDALASRRVAGAEKAIRILEQARPFELGSPAQPINVALYPVYVRGMAYLTSSQGPAAVSEFHKILDNPGAVINEPIGALAHLGLGRGLALTGDWAGAQTAYQSFLTLWQSADPDIPVLKQAKTEAARLAGGK